MGREADVTPRKGGTLSLSTSTTPGSSSASDEDKESEARERILILAAQRREPGAFEEFYNSYRERIWSLLVYLTGDRTQAQDIMQVVFLKAFRGLESFRFRSRPFTWLYRIARNECHNQRRRGIAPPIPLEAILGSKDEIDRVASSNGGDGHNGHEAIVRDAVMRLPLKRREVVVLKYVHGLSYEEISQVLGCATGTVASRLNRALTELEEPLRPLRRRL